MVSGFAVATYGLVGDQIQDRDLFLPLSGGQTVLNAGFRFDRDGPGLVGKANVLVECLPQLLSN